MRAPPRPPPFFGPSTRPNPGSHGPSAGGAAADVTNPCPTPASEPDFDCGAAVTGNCSALCETCGASLAAHRHRILTLERALAWRTECLDSLSASAQRSKRDAQDVYARMLTENHALRLGVGVREHVANIERCRVVSLVDTVASRVEDTASLLQVREELRLAVAARHRDLSKHNAERRALQQQVATLQNALALQGKTHAEEAETLRCRLSRLRHGARARDLAAVADAACGIRDAVADIRSSFVDLLHNGPLSHAAVEAVTSQVGDAIEAMSNAQATRAATARGTLLVAQPAAPRTFAARPGIGTASVTPTPQPAPPGADTQHMRDLCRSLINFWGGYDRVPALQELAANLQSKVDRAAAAAAAAAAASSKPAGSTVTPSSTPAARALAVTSGDASGDEDPSVPEGERLRAGVYSTVTSLLTQGFLTTLLLLDRERAEHTLAARHLASFRQQLRALREGVRVPSSDAATMCTMDEFAESFVDDGDDYDDGMDDSFRDAAGRSSRGQPWRPSPNGRVRQGQQLSQQQQQQQQRRARGLHGEWSNVSAGSVLSSRANGGASRPDSRSFNRPVSRASSEGSHVSGQSRMSVSGMFVRPGARATTSTVSSTGAGTNRARRQPRRSGDGGAAAVTEARGPSHEQSRSSARAASSDLAVGKPGGGGDSAPLSPAQSEIGAGVAALAKRFSIASMASDMSLPALRSDFGEDDESHTTAATQQHRRQQRGNAAAAGAASARATGRHPRRVVRASAPDKLRTARATSASVRAGRGASTPAMPATARAGGLKPQPPPPPPPPSGA